MVFLNLVSMNIVGRSRRCDRGSVPRSVVVGSARNSRALAKQAGAIRAPRLAETLCEDDAGRGGFEYESTLASEKLGDMRPTTAVPRKHFRLQISGSSRHYAVVIELSQLASISKLLSSRSAECYGFPAPSQPSLQPGPRPPGLVQAGPQFSGLGGPRARPGIR